MTKRFLDLQPACLPVSFEHGSTGCQPAAPPILDPLILAPLVLAPLVLALPILPLPLPLPVPVLAPLVLAPLVFAQPIHLQPALPQSIQRWLQPLALRGVGLAAEGIAVFGLGLGAVALTGPAAALPVPAVVALGYMTMLLLGGVLKPADGPRTGLALRVLASAFVCMALAASRSPLGP